MNLTEWVHAQGIHVTAAYRWYREGALPVPARYRALKAGCARRDIGPPAVLMAGSAACGGTG